LDLLPQLQIALNIVIASILSGTVGLERELKKKPAGFRTHMIVGGAAALLLSLGEVLVIHFNELGISKIIQTDPIRIIEAIIVGISFIGAGTILQVRRDDKVLYLTTAASVLFSAGIGIAVALEQYILSIAVTLLILIINYALSKIFKMLSHKEEHED
jgi:putative Mg2+ transporter-C (MgtC) family protein